MNNQPASSVVKVTHNPAIFDQASMPDAMRIILTPEGKTTEERWFQETEWLVELLVDEFEITGGALVLDYGCGIGRVAKALIDKTGCAVVGVDSSAYMRAHAQMYVKSDRFACCAPEMLHRFYGRNCKFDIGLAVWVLQHCLKPVEDIQRLVKALRQDNKLRPGPKFQRGLFVLKNLTRAVPTVEHGWVDDKFDVWGELAETFGAPLKIGKLPMQAAAKLLSDHTQWAIYY